jgi:hypothetical protein
VKIASGDANASRMDLGVSSMRYTVKSSPKDFGILCLLLFLRDVSLFSSSCGCRILDGVVLCFERE